MRIDMHEFLLAYLHFFALFVTYSLLVAELVLLLLPVQPGRWRTLSRLDIGYFIGAIAVLATGLARVFFGFKPALYYWHDGWFHALWITFLLIGLLSIVPTVSFIRWAKAERADPGFTPPAKALRHARGHLTLEILMLSVAPLFAVLMARGYGA